MYAQHRHLSSGIGRRAVWPARQAACENRIDHLGEEPALGTFSPSACAVLTCFAEHPTVAAMLFSSRNAVGMLRDVAP